MAQDPRERLARLARNARLGFAYTREDPRRLAQAQAWLRAHASPRADVDALWHDALEGHGALARWLLEGGDWTLEIPLHTVLASHPFPEVRAWSIQAAFQAS